MAFMAKQRAQRHYNAGTLIVMKLHQASYIDKGAEEACKRIEGAFSSLPKNLKNSEEVKQYLKKHLEKASSSIPGELEEAVKHFQKAVELDPNFAYGFHNLAFVYYDMADYSIAVKQFQLHVQTKMAANVQEETTIALQTLQRRVQEAEDCIMDALESALKAVDRALEIQHNFPQAHNTRAMILAKLGRLDEAIEAIEVALLQKPGYTNAIDNLEKMKQLGRRP